MPCFKRWSNICEEFLRRSLRHHYPVIYQEILQEGVQQGLRQGERFGRLIGRAEGEAMLIIRQLTRRFGSVEPTTQERIQNLSGIQLEALGEALLDFSAITDLILWLDEHQQ
ncbi:MAG: DUF4351 domain-containing protein [Microcoleus sp. SIO2G3]|nr:DUF4351 domain-containing protein [Microcoleus sp. SIO2G3]